MVPRGDRYACDGCADRAGHATPSFAERLDPQPQSASFPRADRSVLRLIVGDFDRIDRRGQEHHPACVLGSLRAGAGVRAGNAAIVPTHAPRRRTGGAIVRAAICAPAADVGDADQLEAIGVTRARCTGFEVEQQRTAIGCDAQAHRGEQFSRVGLNGEQSRLLPE